jgi:hypothetical protein
MTNLDLLRADLRKLSPSNRVFVFAGFDIDPFSDGQLRQYLFTRDEMIAITDGVALPEPTTIRVRVINATPYLRVRDEAKTGAKIGELYTGDVVVVDEIQATAGWWRISEGKYTNGWISADYTEKVT